MLPSTSLASVSLALRFTAQGLLHQEIHLNVIQNLASLQLKKIIQVAMEAHRYVVEQCLLPT
jgi:hypothetical protein